MSQVAFPFAKPLYVMTKPIGAVCNLPATIVITWRKQICIKTRPSM